MGVSRQRGFACREGGRKEKCMNNKIVGLGMLLASGGLVLAVPSYAKAPKAQAAEAAKPQFNISSEARKAIVDLQTAVNAKDTANIPAKVAEAEAKAKTGDDKYIIAQLRLKAAADSNDVPAAAQAIEAILASGVTPEADKIKYYNNLGQIHYAAKAYDKASSALQQVLQRDPNNLEATVMLAESRGALGQTAEAITLVQKAIALKLASGQKPEENWYKRALSFAFNAKLPNSTALARDWVAAYPSPTSWRDTIRIYQSVSRLDDASMIDSMRLARVVGALTSENDYFRIANLLINKGYAGEAKAVLEEGFAASKINKSASPFNQLYPLATSKSQGDRASLAASGKAAMAGTDAKKVMVIADAYYGYGDYAQAAELYRAALGKAGVDKDLANLRLGMTLARSGDKAGATAALNAAGGAQAEVAKLWLTYLATKA
jgi:tetratricopeptide (TPR) repeat protein